MLTAKARPIVFAEKLTPEKVKIEAKNVDEEITFTTMLIQYYYKRDVIFFRHISAMTEWTFTIRPSVAYLVVVINACYFFDFNRA